MDLSNIFKDRKYPKDKMIYFENIYNEISTFLDDDFINQLSNANNSQFKQRLSELLIIYDFSQKVDLIERKGSCHPDMSFNFNNIIYNVEIITPDEEILLYKNSGGWNKITTEQENKMKLRILNVIQAKKEQYKKWKSRKIINNNDINIIGINTTNTGCFPVYKNGIDLIESVIIGKEEMRVSISRKSSDITDVCYRHENEVIKDNGSHVDRLIFENPEYNIISGILHIQRSWPYYIHFIKNENTEIKIVQEFYDVIKLFRT